VRELSTDNDDTSSFFRLLGIIANPTIEMRRVRKASQPGATQIPSMPLSTREHESSCGFLPEASKDLAELCTSENG
jgi:hypothetical protein